MKPDEQWRARYSSRFSWWRALGGLGVFTGQAVMVVLVVFILLGAMGSCAGQ